LSEGFPLTVLEAWACKLPVLTTSVGELPYIIKDDYNGWLVSPNNVEELSKKLKYVLNLDRKKLTEVGENGYKLVKEKYSWDEIIKNIYDELTNIIRS
jgi:glycosyltransferase involved in cell wall biosynthesis